MMILRQITTIIAITAICSSFILLPSTETIVYGVSSDDPSQIQLTLENNHHFTYQDYSDINNKIDLQGNWKKVNNHIELISTNGERNFHWKWKMSDNGEIAKSRYKICFYTLKRLK